LIDTKSYLLLCREIPTVQRIGHFLKLLHGAEVGDLFMALIDTCQLCGANSFDYLTELQRHARELTANPAAWMPGISARRWSRLAYDGYCLAEKDHLRPGGTVLVKCP
jgi:hypothetical protein